MLAPPITLAHVLNAEESESALRIPISLKVHDQTVSTTALIDSGAEGQFIDSRFTIRNHIPTHPLTKPIPVLNVDGTPNQNGTITHYAWRFLKLGPKYCAAKLLITSLGKESLILGLPWLKWHNPTIDWQAHTVTIKRTSTATTLAQQAGETATDNKPVTRIPAVYSRFTTLFEKKAASRLPEHRPYDHAINLKPDFLPKDCKTYPLTPKENIATMEFINENLEKGYIRPSKSPMASPFFFVGKKDSTLRPCQDYRHVNEGTIKDAYPFPLIPDLMDKLKGVKFFTKLDLRLGYNNVRIKPGDEWKAAFCQRPTAGTAEYQAALDTNCGTAESGRERGQGTGRRGAGRRVGIDPRPGVLTRTKLGSTGELLRTITTLPRCYRALCARQQV